MKDVLDVVFVLAVGVALGSWLQQRLAIAEADAALVEELAAENAGRVSQSRCRCSECQAPFLQQTPDEVQ